MPPPWRSGGGIEPRASVTGGLHAGRTPAQFRQERDAIGAEKLVSDQQALLRCAMIRYKKSCCYEYLHIQVRLAGLTLAFDLQRRPCPVTTGPKRQFAQNQDGTPPGYGLQARLGALVHAIENGAARPAVLKVQASSAGGAPQVQHYCRHRRLLGHEAVEPLATASFDSCNLRKFVSIHDRGFRFSYFPVIFVWEAPIETRILDRYSSTGAKIRVK